MSSGAKISSYLIAEVTPGVTPAGAFDTLRLTGNTLSPTVATQASDEITDQRISQGSVATSTDIGGDLTAELSYGGAFDKLFEAGFYGSWTSDVLTVGDTRRTFTVAKNFNDVNVFTLFKGMHVSSFAVEIPSDGKITATFSLMGLDYADGDTNTVVTITPPTSTPFMSNINVGTLLVNGESLEGVACVSAMSINLDNSLQTQRCLGTGKLGPGAHIATEAAITGSVTLAWSNKAWTLWKNTFTRAPISVSFPIIDSLGNKYIFDFPALEIDGDLPNGGKRDLVEVTLNYTVAKVAPTLTRVPFVAVTSVSVTPPTATIAVAGTQQLAASVLPSGASQAVTWSSSAPSKATVSPTGLVTGVASGSATITATSVSDGTKVSSSTITVS